MPNKLSSAKKRQFLGSLNWNDLNLHDNGDDHPSPQLMIFYKHCQVWPQAEEDGHYIIGKLEHQLFIRKIMELFIKQKPELFNENILYNMEWVTRDAGGYLQNHWFRRRQHDSYGFSDSTQEMYDEIFKRIEGEKDAESRAEKESEDKEVRGVV